MNIFQSNIERALLRFGLPIFLALLISYAIVTKSHLLMPALGSLGLLVLFIMKFEIVFPFLLIFRSTLDSFAEIGFELGPITFNVPAGLSTFIDIAGLFYFLGLITAKKVVLFDRVAKSYGIWLLLLSIWVWLAYRNFGQEGLVGVREWVRLFSIFAIYFLSLQLANLKGYKYLVASVMLSLVVPLSMALYQTLFSATTMRVQGTFIHPNAFALYLILCIGLTFWTLKFSVRKKPWFLLLVLELFVLWNTFSIGGAISFSVFGIVLIIKETWKKTKYIFVIMMMFFLVLSGLVLSELGKERFQELEQTPRLQEMIKEEIVTNSLSWRIVNWKKLFQEWSRRPLMGYGLDTCGKLVSPWKNEAHNDYIRYLVELGIIGLIPYLLLVRAIGVDIWKKYKGNKDEQKGYLALIVFAIFLSWTVGAIWDNHMTATAFQFYFWAILAAI
jgi:O-antigen ligase